MTKRDQIEKRLRALGGKHEGAHVRYINGKGYFAHTQNGVLFFATAAHAVNYIHDVKRTGYGNLANLRVGMKARPNPETDKDFELFAAFDLGAAARQRAGQIAGLLQ